MPALGPGAQISRVTISWPLWRAHVHGEGAFALVQARPEQALVIVGDRPAVIVEAAPDSVEANDFRAHLRQRHPRQGRRHERGALDHPQTFQNFRHHNLSVE